MIKKIHIACLLYFPIHSFAQAGNVGINTPNPVRTLHVEGNFLLKKVDLKTSPNDALYNRVLVKDNTTGNVDEIPLSAFQSYVNTNPQAGKYVDLQPDSTSILASSLITIGCFSIRYNKTGANDGSLQYLDSCDNVHVTKKTRYWSIISAAGFFNFNEFDTPKNNWENLELINYNQSTTANIQLGVFYKTNLTSEIYNMIVTSNNNPAEMIISVEKY